jgi:hypothetical protein
MHDDDAPVTPEPVEPERYWTEAEWEQSMLENERLMDKYQKVWEEQEVVEGPAQEPEAAEASGEPKEDDAPLLEPGDREIDDVREIPAYQLALGFAHAALDYMKRFEHEQRGQNPLREQFCLHALRIAADIAGGHGMGYEEDVLCGNIVKNRWALGHAQEAARILKVLMERDGSDPESSALLAKLPPIIKALEERIAELRTKVWWDRK